MQKEYFGIGALEQIHPILNEEKPLHIFLVRGRKSYQRSGAEQKLEPLLQGYGVTPFLDFSANTKVSDVEKAVTLFRQKGCDFVIAIGGGSALDLAKAVALLADHHGKVKEYILQKELLHARTTRMVAIPTTSGTGSESTHFAAIYIDKKKYSLTHPSLVPDYAIIDPSLTFSLPPYQTACTGMDALSQAIESYWSIHSTEESKQYAREAITLALTNLEKAVNNPDSESRIAMAKAANFAGKAIDISFTTACHAISYPITSYFNIPHGQAVALTLPEMVTYNVDTDAENCQDPRGAAYVQQVLQEISSLLNVSSPLMIKQRLENLLDSIHLRRNLSPLGINNTEEINTIIRQSNPERMTNNPRKITEPNLREILQKIC